MKKLLIILFLIFAMVGTAQQPSHVTRGQGFAQNQAAHRADLAKQKVHTKRMKDKIKSGELLDASVLFNTNILEETATGGRAETFSGPIRFMDLDGEIKDIDNEFVELEFDGEEVFANLANDPKTFISKDVLRRKIYTGGHYITIQPFEFNGEALNQIEVIQQNEIHKVLFEGAFPDGIIAEYSATAGGTKEVFILPEGYVVQDISIKYHLITERLTPSLTEDGRLRFVTESGGQVAKFSKLKIFDSLGKKILGTQSLEGNILETTITAQALSTAVFPVYIDPDMQTGTASISTGAFSGEKEQMFFELDLSPINGTIDSADFHLYKTSSDGPDDWTLGAFTALGQNIVEDSTTGATAAGWNYSSQLDVLVVDTGDANGFVHSWDIYGSTSEGETIAFAYDGAGSVCDPDPIIIRLTDTTGTGSDVDADDVIRMGDTAGTNIIWASWANSTSSRRPKIVFTYTGSLSCASAPGAPSLTGPTNGGSEVSTLTSVNKTISWTNVSNETGYGIFRDGGYIKTVAANSTSTSLSFSAGTGGHTWDVKAEWSGSDVTSSNGPWSYTIIQQPVFNLSIPTNNAHQSGLVPTFTWGSHEGSRVATKSEIWLRVTSIGGSAGDVYGGGGGIWYDFFDPNGTFYGYDRPAIPAAGATLEWDIRKTITEGAYESQQSSPAFRTLFIGTVPSDAGPISPDGDEFSVSDLMDFSWDDSSATGPAAGDDPDPVPDIEISINGGGFINRNLSMSAGQVAYNNVSPATWGIVSGDNVTWRIEWVNPYGTVQSTTTKSFSVLDAPGPFTLIEPDASDKNAFEQDIFFDWNVSSDADEYTLQYENGTWITLESGIVTTDATVTAGTIPVGTWNWRVIAANTQPPNAYSNELIVDVGNEPSASTNPFPNNNFSTLDEGIHPAFTPGTTFPADDHAVQIRIEHFNPPGTPEILFNDVVLLSTKTEGVDYVISVGTGRVNILPAWWGFTTQDKPWKITWDVSAIGVYGDGTPLSAGSDLIGYVGFVPAAFTIIAPDNTDFAQVDSIPFSWNNSVVPTDDYDASLDIDHYRLEYREEGSSDAWSVFEPNDTDGTPNNEPGSSFGQGDWEWRAVAVNNYGETISSNVLLFQVVDPPVAATNLTPAAASLHVGKTTVFAWDSDPNAATTRVYYEWYLANGKNGGGAEDGFVWSSPQDASTEFLTVVFPNEPQTIIWKVESTNPAGVVETSTVEYEQGDIPASFDVTSPTVTNDIILQDKTQDLILVWEDNGDGEGLNGTKGTPLWRVETKIGPANWVEHDMVIASATYTITSGTLADGTYSLRVGYTNDYGSRYISPLITLNIGELPEDFNTSGAAITYTVDTSPSFAWLISNNAEFYNVFQKVEEASSTYFDGFGGDTFIESWNADATTNAPYPVPSRISWYVRATNDFGTKNSGDGTKLLYIGEVPGDFTLTSPLGSAVGLGVNNDFDWSAAGQTGLDNTAIPTYVINIYTGITLQHTSSSNSGGLDTTYTLPADTLSTEDNYNWEVLATNNYGTTLVLGGTFTTIPNPQAFDLTSPGDGLNGPRRPVFVWGDSISADDFDLYIDAVKDNVSPITGTTYTPTSDLSKTTHTWYVIANNVSGSTQSTSTFTVTVGDEPSAFSLDTPADEVRVEGADQPISLAWFVSTGDPDITYDVYINRNGVGFVAEQTDLEVLTWNILTNLSIGYHQWYVVAKNDFAETQSTETRTIVIFDPNARRGSASIGYIIQ